MNKLAHILLGLLYRKPYNGYELKQLLQLFWAAHHSQIYPLLAKLEKDGYVSFEETTDVPPKKIYSLTEKGVAKVEEWLNEPSTPNQPRDEWIAKVYILSDKAQHQAALLFHERRTQLKKKLENVRATKQVLETLKQEDPSEWQKQFGRVLIIERHNRLYEEELNWCDWAEETFQAFQ